ncbi:uncharacterized protein A4U43_C05F34870 [Asparagus officinalis]|uniref:Uncharacterized protein n=1 Tax=Asparagus officinalis TaxID=4686 RepID=A0A5P1F297_ASPOF|nr:uncharacterized protein A4U43_C05F34870 [Asparagus officinalis]
MLKGTGSIQRLLRWSSNPQKPGILTVPALNAIQLHWRSAVLSSRVSGGWKLEASESELALICNFFLIYRTAASVTTVRKKRSRERRNLFFFPLFFLLRCSVAGTEEGLEFC